MPEEFAFPKTSHHTTVIGRTGSGKTIAGAWVLSHAPFDDMPYIIVDFKGDEFLNTLGAMPISHAADPPDKPGLYIMRLKSTDIDDLEHFLWKVHAQGRTGLFFDEGFVVAKSKALENIYMQGRSKDIPVFTLTQRPAWISRYAFSEASHFLVGDLNDDRDQEKVEHFFRDYNPDRPKKYHFQWYDVNEDLNFHLHPVPHPDTIRERITERLDVMREQSSRKHFI